VVDYLRFWAIGSASQDVSAIAEVWWITSLTRANMQAHRGNGSEGWYSSRYTQRALLTPFGDELPDGVNETPSAIARIAAVRQFGLLAHFQRDVCPSGAIADDRSPYWKTSF
jgi:hypothetical protein